MRLLWRMGGSAFSEPSIIAAAASGVVQPAARSRSLSSVAPRSIMNSVLDLKHIWLSRLDAARQVHEEAARELDRLVGEWDHGLLPDSSGLELIRQARRREHSALDEYVRVLRTCTDLVVHGKLPE